MLAMICWVLSMISAIVWAPTYTAMLTAATLISALLAPTFAWVSWGSWARLAILGSTPWLLAPLRRSERWALKQLHAEEARRMAHLNESARGRLSLQRETQQIETQIATITDLYHVTKQTSGTLHWQELFAASLDIAPRLLAVQGLRLIDASGSPPRVLRAARAPEGRLVPLTLEGQPNSGSEALSELEQEALRRIRASPKAVSATPEMLACPLPEGVSRIAWAPLWRQQQTVGVLVAEGMPPEQLDMLAIVANQLSLQLARIHLYQQVEALAVTDALTGVFVRGHFMERAREEVERSARHGLSCTLLMADLDLFKQKNDTFGHLVGDVVLREVARLLQRHLREIDLIARFGGEEFILLLIETDLEEGLPVAQRLRQLVEVHPIRAYDELLTQTISMGVAGFPVHAQTIEGLIERADQALYAAKRAGRNQVVLWSQQLSVV